MRSSRIPRAGLVLALTLVALLAPAAAQAADFKVQLVRVETPTPASKDLLQTLELDLAEGGGRASIDAVIWKAEELAKLERAGFEYRVRIPDMAARLRANQERDRRFARSAAAADGFPSGSTGYRTMDEINKEMQTLAAENPDLVRLIKLREKSLLGKDIFAMEIAQNVTAEDDGRPVFLNMAVHHAREWPSAEHALEWGYEMVKATKAGEERASGLTRDIRTIVLPVVNPDGYDISRTFEPVDYPGGGAAEVGSFKRKNCNITDKNNATFDNSTDAMACIGAPTLGTDPNRNYGGLWGGPGASSDPTAADYRGPGPFSEPETRNVQHLVSTRHVTTLITNHTYTGLVLRPPGVAAQGPSVDEPLYKALGDAMAAKNGYISQPSYDLYDTTGTTEDWSYYTTGGLGFTFEIGPDEFHPPYEEVVKEWNGNVEAFEKANGGNREAYYVAAESTRMAPRHSVIRGKAPAGHVLRLRKQFTTKTSPVQDSSGRQGDVIEFVDSLDTSMKVPASGEFEWDINPSTRPAVAARPGREPTAPPSDPIELDEQPALPEVPAEIPFTYEVERDANGKKLRDDGTMTVEVTNPAPLEDYDIAVYRIVDGERVLEGGSAQFVNVREAVNIPEPEEGDYILEVSNFAATGVSYTANVTFQSPKPAQPGNVEVWTLSCETPDGTAVLGVQPVEIARGQELTVDPCTKRDATTGGGSNTNTNTTTTTVVQPPPGDPACQSRTGLVSATARGAAGSAVRLAFKRRIERPVTVDVFQQSRGRRVIGERLVRRFTGKAKTFTWDGKDRRGRTVPDGFYFARFRLTSPDGVTDTIRVTLGRSKGKFGPRRGFYRRDSCGAVGKFKLSRPVFGGPDRRALGITYRLNQPGRAQVTVTDRRERVVKRFPAREVAAGRSQKLTLPAAGLARGDYRVKLSVTAGGRGTTTTLTSRRL